MTLLAPIEFSATDKLRILERLDQFRKWSSLDDKRYCLVCGGLMNGHDILVVGGTRGTGPLRLICPTRGCPSIPMDWVLPSDEVLARMSMLHDEPLPFGSKSRSERPENFGARLRKFAAHFRRAA